ncbi:3-hydroxyacyl-CoA dehydrogenase family protein [Marinomonas algarum]|uniref:NAD(P)-binding domain-containing protein n=1 Tax=Marinomonas algarum TaxID=2883105 RepID=A0A9X1ILZ8_9GAMM|nr:3-hydroxyacyl-CoA dehydrogenase NAD-binding domain-containing protein [Marinomonas algarum]MCB5160731.1 NAD(P)-binding domain-containing protein [Marinomonas algarum]
MSIQIIGVIGAGQMGQGIAQVMACAGYQVQLVDSSADALDKAVIRIRQSIEKLTGKGLLEANNDYLAAIQCSTELSSLTSANLVIEAATESEKVKTTIFQALASICPASTLFASNTSSLSITRLAASIPNPERMIGMHFMNPVPLMQLVEVIEGLQTDKSTTMTVMEVAKRAGKISIPVKDRAGFVLNRILLPMINEAVFVLEERNATEEQIDQIMMLGAAHPIGPLALADLIGLDTCLSIMDVLYTQFGDSKYRAAPLLRQMVDAGRLGKKVGQGFYHYER